MELAGLARSSSVRFALACREGCRRIFANTLRPSCSQSVDSGKLVRAYELAGTWAAGRESLGRWRNALTRIRRGAQWAGGGMVVEKLDETKAILNAILEGQQAIGAKLEAMDLRLARVEGHVGEMDKRLGRVEAHVAQNTEDLGDVLSSVKYLVHKAGEHERDIYVLKSKAGE